MNKIEQNIVIFLPIVVALFVIFSVVMKDDDKISYTLNYTAPETIQLDELEIVYTDDTHTLVGRVTNNSDIHITLLNSRLTCTINNKEHRQSVVIGQEYNEALGRVEPISIPKGERYGFSIPLAEMTYANDVCTLEVLNWSKYGEI